MLHEGEKIPQEPIGKVVLHDVHDNQTVNINYLHSIIKDAIKEAYQEIKNENI